MPTEPADQEGSSNRRLTQEETEAFVTFLSDEDDARSRSNLPSVSKQLFEDRSEPLSYLRYMIEKNSGGEGCSSLLSCKTREEWKDILSSVKSRLMEEEFAAVKDLLRREEEETPLPTQTTETPPPSSSRWADEEADEIIDPDTTITSLASLPSLPSFPSSVERKEERKTKKNDISTKREAKDWYNQRLSDLETERESMSEPAFRRKKSELRASYWEMVERFSTSVSR